MNLRAGTSENGKIMNLELSSESSIEFGDSLKLKWIFSKPVNLKLRWIWLDVAYMDLRAECMNFKLIWQSFPSYDWPEKNLWVIWEFISEFGAQIQNISSEFSANQWIWSSDEFGYTYLIWI